MPEKREQGSSVWYTRRGGVVQGPFPAGLIRRYVILGRLRMNDELSRDLSSWTPLEDLPDLIPYFMQDDQDDPRIQRRLIAAMRWEDERGHPDRRLDDQRTAEERRDAGDRRRIVNPVVPVRRKSDNDIGEPSQAVPNRHRGAVVAGLLAVFVVAVVVMFQTRPVVLEDGADCRLPPQPDVDWSNCSMDGRNLNGVDLRSARMSNMALSQADLGSARLASADLSFSNLSVASLRAADLSAARMMGTSLRGSDLSGANLEDAELSYADLRNATLDGARIDGTRFDHAVWTDGSECLPGSIGACLTTIE